MPTARNMVLDGAFKGKYIMSTAKGYSIIKGGAFNKIALVPANVISYEIVGEDHQKSMTSGVARGIVGGAVFGPLGAIAGGISGRQKGIYQMIITFRNGGSSLIEVDEDIHRDIISQLSLSMRQQPIQENETNYVPSQPVVETTHVADTPTSVAEEISKLKDLLDTGALTQEEFELMKKRLLNI